MVAPSLPGFERKAGATPVPKGDHCSSKGRHASLSLGRGFRLEMFHPVPHVHQFYLLSSNYVTDSVSTFIFERKSHFPHCYKNVFIYASGNMQNYHKNSNLGWNCSACFTSILQPWNELRLHKVGSEENSLDINLPGSADSVVWMHLDHTEDEQDLRCC